MSTNTENILLSIRDLVIEFRTKGKKFKAVKEASFDIHKGEIFGIVGESGSGKTTIGRAIVGVQPIKDGAIYMNDTIVGGKPTSLYTLNKDIAKKINSMLIKADMTSKELDRTLEALKDIYYFYKDQNKLLDIKELKSKLKDSKIKYVKDISLNNLKDINRIIKNQDRMIKFTTNLNAYIPEISKKLEKSVLSKIIETKEAVLDLKEFATNVYNCIEEILNLRGKFIANKNKDIEAFFTAIFKQWNTLVENHKDYLKKIKWVSDMQYQSYALSAPKSKRESFINYYNKLIYIKRDEFWKECVNQLNILKNQGIDESDENFKKLSYYIQDFWSNKNFNTNASKKILSLLSEGHPIDERIVSLGNKLKNTDFERNLKNLIDNNATLSKKELKDLSKELEQIKKIIQKNIVKDKELIESFYKWKDIQNPYSEDEVDSFIELTEFLELPSIDEFVKNSFLFAGQTRKEKRKNRRNIQMIFQDPGSSLNDRMAIEEIIAEGMENFPELYKGDEARERFLKEHNEQNPHDQLTMEQVTHSMVKKHIILNLVKSVGLLPEHLSRYPHEFSGGQRQRVGIARSLAMRPQLIVADEPISALDVSIRAQVLNLFKKFQELLDLTFIFVAHDLSVVRYIADRIAVIYHGQIVELAPAEELFSNPLHPYTKALLSAIPIPEPELAKETKLQLYEPEKEHFDYIFELPYFKEILPGHFVWANSREIRKIKSNLKNRERS